MIGVITPTQLLRWWRQAIVVIVVIAAVITPSGDPISMSALAIPMVLLYALSVALGALILILRRRSTRKAAVSDSDAVAD